MSVSIRDVSGTLNNEKVHRLSSDLSYDAMSFADVGGTLADQKEEPYAPSSPTSASSTLTLSPRVAPPGLPGSPHTDLIIDISFIRHLVVEERPTGSPKPILNIASAPKHATDTPSGVHRNTHDMV
jgi:pheromone a factor receptor